MTIRLIGSSPAIRAVARVVFGLVVLGALVIVVGGEPFVRGLAAVTPVTMGAAALCTLIATVAAAWRWRTLARRLGAPLPWGAAIGAYYRSQLLNSILPGGVVGDVHRAIDHGRRTGRVAEASRAVVTERVAGQLVQLVAAALVLGALGTRLAVQPWTVVAVAGAAGALIAVILAASARARRAVARELTIVGIALRDPATVARTAIASLIVVGAHAATFVVACLAVGVPADPVRLAAVALVTVLAGSVPLSVGGWGTREAVAAWAFAGVGLGASAGVAASTAFGVLATVSVLPGLIVLIAPTVARARAARAALTPPSATRREPA